jgi:heptosyltransferase-2
VSGPQDEPGARGEAAALVPLGKRAAALTPQPEPEAVLVLRFSALGDVLLTSPALEALHAAWPRARIVYAVKERLAPLVAHNPAVSAVVGLGETEGVFSLAARLRAATAGASSVAVLDLHGKLRSRLLRALLPRAHRRVVWEKRDWRDTLPVKLGLRPWRSDRLFCDRYHDAVEQLVGRRLPRGRLQAFLGPGDAAGAARVLRGAGVRFDKVDSEGRPSPPLVGLSPGANWATKQWPAERYAELARRALVAGLQVAVQGSAAERALGAAIVRAAPGAVDLTGLLDVPQLAGFTSLCAAYAANDSGPMHLARALGVPTLAFFGSTDPEMFAWGGHRVLFAGVECAPCSFFGRKRCPKGHLRCMTELSVQQAWEALEGLLRGGKRALLGA